MKVQLMSVAKLCVLLITSMNLEARLLEQNVSPELTVWAVEEHLNEKPMEVNACTILNLQHPDAHSLLLPEWLDAFVRLQADMLCIQGLTNAEQAHDTCEALQEHYAYFLYVDPTTSKKQDAIDHNKLLIASKHSFVTRDSNLVTINAVNFIVDTYFWQENVKTLILSSLTEEVGAGYAISVCPVHILNNFEGLLAHIVENIPWSLQNNSDSLLAYQDVILVKRDGGGDKEAGSSVMGSLDITLGGGDGPRVSGSIKGEMHDSRGNCVEGSVSYNTGTGETRINISGGRESSYGSDRETGTVLDRPDNDK